VPMIETATIHIIARAVVISISTIERAPSAPIRG